MCTVRQPKRKRHPLDLLLPAPLKTRCARW